MDPPLGSEDPESDPFGLALSLAANDLQGLEGMLSNSPSSAAPSLDPWASSSSTTQPAVGLNHGVGGGETGGPGDSHLGEYGGESDFGFGDSDLNMGFTAGGASVFGDPFGTTEPQPLGTADDLFAEIESARWDLLPDSPVSARPVNSPFQRFPPAPPMGRGSNDMSDVLAPMVQPPPPMFRQPDMRGPPRVVPVARRGVVSAPLSGRPTVLLQRPEGLPPGHQIQPPLRAAAPSFPAPENFGHPDAAESAFESKRQGAKNPLRSVAAPVQAKPQRSTRSQARSSDRRDARDQSVRKSGPEKREKASKSDRRQRETSSDAEREAQLDRPTKKRATDSGSDDNVSARTVQSNGIPCKFFAGGSCKKGPYCEFVHLDMRLTAALGGAMALDPYVTGEPTSVPVVSDENAVSASQSSAKQKKRGSRGRRKQQQMSSDGGRSADEGTAPAQSGGSHDSGAQPRDPDDGWSVVHRGIRTATVEKESSAFDVETVPLGPLLQEPEGPRSPEQGPGRSSAQPKRAPTKKERKAEQQRKKAVEEHERDLLRRQKEEEEEAEELRRQAEQAEQERERQRLKAESLRAEVCCVSRVVVSPLPAPLLCESLTFVSDGCCSAARGRN
jgi:hypothetical protein